MLAPAGFTVVASARTAHNPLGLRTVGTIIPIQLPRTCGSVAISGVQALVAYGGRRKPSGGDEQAVAKLTDYVMTAEAAEILGVAQNTIRKWAAQGKIPMYRNPANGYRLFKRGDLEKFLRTVEASKTKPPSQRKLP